MNLSKISKKVAPKLVEDKKKIQIFVEIKIKQEKYFGNKKQLQYGDLFKENNYFSRKKILFTV